MKYQMLLKVEFCKQRSFFNVVHRETPEMLASILELNNVSCFGDCCKRCGCWKYKKVTKFNIHAYPWRTYLNFLRKVLRNSLWTNFYLKMCGTSHFEQFKLFLQSLCELCVKNTEHLWASPFVEDEFKPHHSWCWRNFRWLQNSTTLEAHVKISIICRKTSLPGSLLQNLRVKWCKIGLRSLYDSYCPLHFVHSCTFSLLFSVSWPLCCVTCVCEGYFMLCTSMYLLSRDKI